MKNILPFKGKFGVKQVGSNVTKDNRGFNPNNVQNNMGKAGRENCRHQWSETTLKVVRDGFGNASKHVQLRCLLCGAIANKNIKYIDSRIYGQRK
jgi:hypothetical protein